MARYYRKIIKITALDSPNVKYAMAQIRAGLTPTGENIIPGVLPWADYCKRRDTWDAVKKCIGLDAEFYEGGEVLLFPPTWLTHAETLAERWRGTARNGKGMGIDSAEGRD